jgi:hypothetical protein
LGSLSAHHQEFLAYIGFGTLYAVVTVCYQEQDGFIHKESVTMPGHTIVKFIDFVS